MIDVKAEREALYGGVLVVAVLSSAVQLGERPPAVELGGMALVGAALVLLAVLGLRRPQPLLPPRG